MDMSSREILHIDCDSCRARGLACGDCVVTVLLGPADTTIDLDVDEQAALAVLADSGLVPPLRLVPGTRRVTPVQARLDWPDYA